MPWIISGDQTIFGFMMGTATLVQLAAQAGCGVSLSVAKKKRIQFAITPPARPKQIITAVILAHVRRATLNTNRARPNTFSKVQTDAETAKVESPFSKMENTSIISRSRFTVGN